ncbi:uncharacterized protein LOC123529174 [Mercenaria mercenaria]|uniref:uncharacterized protein LOC123529174 n=1 Tax=Mercenaria mercenaria TaxID=6596 RepID=UPI001E1DAAE9|nr:uncharacterized protein LOC123529174 [Mercenaria mercenaria]
MALEVSPSQLQFESVEEPSQIELTLNNGCSNAVTYRFRLQSKAIIINHPKGTLEKQQAKTILVDYDPNLNTSKDILLSMQLKSSEVQDGKPGKEHTKLIPISFLAEKDMEDEMFKSPMSSEVKQQRTDGRWWKK